MFDWLRRPKQPLDDPVFGPMQRHSSGWLGRVFFKPAGREIYLHVVTDGAEPAKAHHDAFEELSGLYGALGSDIERALFELWLPWLEMWDTGQATVPRSEDEMLARTELVALEHHPDGSWRLHFGFLPEVGREFAELSVSLSDGIVEADSFHD